MMIASADINLGTGSGGSVDIPIEDSNYKNQYAEAVTAPSENELQDDSVAMLMLLP